MFENCHYTIEVNLLIKSQCLQSDDFPLAWKKKTTNPMKFYSPIRQTNKTIAFMVDGKFF